jgi:hypothetical protein
VLACDVGEDHIDPPKGYDYNTWRSPNNMFRQANIGVCRVDGASVADGLVDGDLE